MAAWTAAQVRLRALKELGIVGAGQSASAEDDSDIGEAYDSLYADLQRDGHAPFLQNAVPKWAAVPLAKLLAWEASEMFGFTGGRLDTIKRHSRDAKKTLMRNSANKKGQGRPRISTHF